MTNKFNNLTEIADEMDLPLNATVESLIDEITDLGHSDRVYHRYDESIGLKSSVDSEKLRNMDIEDADDCATLSEEEQRQYDRILEVAENVLSFNEIELSDDEREECEQNEADWEGYIENIDDIDED